MAPLQAIDATTLKALLAEQRATLLPARFEKAQQSDGRTLQLGLRSLDARPWLELSWQAEAPRLLEIPPPPRQGEGSTLAQQLQHGLRGLALVGLEQAGWERVVTLAFAERPGAAVSRRLVLELMGRHSNLFLLEESGRVIAIGRQVRERQSRPRPIGNGDLYSPPPPPSGDPPDAAESFGSWQRRLQLLPLPLGVALRQAYQGISPALARQLVTGTPAAAGPEALLDQPVNAIESACWQHLHQRWQQWLTAVAAEHFTLQLGGATPYCCWRGCRGDAGGDAGPKASSWAEPDPQAGAINAGLARYYARELGQRTLAEARRRLTQRLRGRGERQRRQLAEQERRLAEIENAAALQEQADALLCLAQPSRDQIDTAQSLYRRARKLRRSLTAIEARLDEHRRQLAWIDSSLTLLELADSLPQVEALAEECAAQETPGRDRASRMAAGPGEPLELASPGGLRLLVGRNHRQNEAISLRQARRGDLWFHAQECPGSHVVLKSSEAPADAADHQAGADLAAHFSRARGNRRVPVLMVPVEQLQRLPGSAPGTVRHRGGAVLWGEPERAAALLRAHTARSADAARSLGTEQAR